MVRNSNDEGRNHREGSLTYKLFKRRYESLSNKPVQQCKYISEVYQDLFKSEAPTDKHSVLIEQKVAYELLLRDTGRPSKRLLRRHRAAQEMDLNKFDRDRRSILELRMKTTEDVMATTGQSKKTSKSKAPKEKKPSARIGKTSGLGLNAFACRLFDAQSKAKLTDEKLVQEMQKEFPLHGFDVSRIVHYRNVYNRGGLTGQTKKPAKPLEEIGGKKPAEKPSKKAPTKKKTTTSKKKVIIKRKKTK